MKIEMIRELAVMQCCFLMGTVAASSTVGCSPPPAARREASAAAKTSETTAEATDFPRVGFPILPPRADANPNLRRPRDLVVPTRLLVERSEERIAVKVDKESLQSESVLVGENMIVGYAFTTDIVSEGKPVRTFEHGLTGVPGNSVSYVNTQIDGIPVAGQTYTIERRYTIFETDIPPQHMWSPESEKYRVLLTRTIRARVEP